MLVGERQEYMNRPFISFIKKPQINLLVSTIYLATQIVFVFIKNVSF